jgi:hypothetical protein
VTGHAQRAALTMTLALTAGCISVAGPGVPGEFDRGVEVFGVTVWATPCVSQQALLRAGNVLAQYLDADQNGHPDNPMVAEELSALQTTILLFADAAEAQAFHTSSLPAGIQAYRFLLASQVNPWFDPAAPNTLFDESLTGILAIITEHGYANAYPQIFGTTAGTQIAQAMDAARGGHFPGIPPQYPSGAWYTPTGPTDYGELITDYLGWAITSSLGAQAYPGRLEEIEDTWQLNTPELLRQVDTLVIQLLDDPGYSLPHTLPDGNYQGFTIEVITLQGGT